MSESSITLQLDARNGEAVGHGYQPDETLAGYYQVKVAAIEDFRAVELSVLWYTVGQGEEDFGVHFFERYAGDDQMLFKVGQPHPFSTRLPNSPLSYQGVLVNVRWCVRVRLFLTRGREMVEEVPFQLADVPPAEALLD